MSAMTVIVEESNITVVSVAEQGPAGTNGAAGATGAGVASGGSTGQFLKKNSATNFDTSWAGIVLGTDVSGTLAVANGGTGATNAMNAQKNLKGACVLGASAVASSVTGTTTETTLASVTIPANAMGANGIVRVTTAWSYTNSANNKTLKVKFGGTNYGNTNVTTTGNIRDQRQIANRNATNAQIGTSATLGGFVSSSGALVTSAIDTTAAVDITFTGTLANTGETITLEYYLVELLVP